MRTLLCEPIVRICDDETLIICTCGFTTTAPYYVDAFIRFTNHLELDCPTVIGLQQRIRKDPDVTVAHVDQENPPVQESGERTGLRVGR